MRKTLLLVVLGACVAQAQDNPMPERHRFVVVGGSFGVTLGGANPLAEPTYLQAMRGSAVVGIRGSHAVELTATRLQAVFPATGFTESELRNPEGDALILSYANLTWTRDRGLPTEAAIGGGVIHRDSRDTWVARVALDMSPFKRWQHFDVTSGVQAFAMPGDESLTAVLVVGLYFRIG